MSEVALCNKNGEVVKDTTQLFTVSFQMGHQMAYTPRQSIGNKIGSILAGLSPPPRLFSFKGEKITS